MSGIREHHPTRAISRRAALSRLGGAGVVLAAVPLLNGKPAMAAGQAAYLTWAGYDDPAFFGPYRKKHGADPEVALFDEPGQALYRLLGGTIADLSHPCNASLPRWKASGQFQPIDTARLSNWPDVMAPLKTLPAAQDELGQWFVPFEWGQTSIAYRSDLVDWQGQAESWNLLWDDRYKGRLAVIDSAAEAWWCAAILAGLDFGEVTGDDLKKVKALLAAQRPLLRLYSADTADLATALGAGEIVAAMAWNATAATLARQNPAIKFAHPREGALTWACGLMLHKDAPEVDKAYDLIDSLLDPEVGAYLIKHYGHGHANATSFEPVPEDRLAGLGFSPNPMASLEKGIFQIPLSPELESRIISDFEEIKAGA